MATVSERVFQMKTHFMELHEAGWTIPEIADKFNLSKPTVYRHLESIASANGVTRDSLLKEVHKTPTYWVHQSNSLKVDANQLAENFDIAQKALQDISIEILTFINIIEEDLKNDI